MSAPLRTVASFLSGVRVVEVSGEVDLASARTFEEALEAQRAHPVLVLSLEGLRYIDSSGLTVLIREHKRRTEAGSPLLVVLPRPPASRIFEVTRLTELLTHFPDLPAAVEAAKT